MTSLLDRRSDWPSFGQAAPSVVAALGMLGKAVDDSGLDKQLTELLKLRASQINGCAFCLRFHLNIARKIGLAQDKIDLVAAWREAGVFSARERAALAWTEALTLMAQKHIADAHYAELQALFTESEIAFLTTAVGTINAWNRIAGALQFSPPAPMHPVSGFRASQINGCAFCLQFHLNMARKIGLAQDKIDLVVTSPPKPVTSKLESGIFRLVALTLF